MTEQKIDLGFLKFSIYKWLGENQWLNTSPKHDYSSTYFFNFFKKKFPGLSKETLDDALWELAYEEEFIEVDDDPDGTIDIIRGLTPKGYKHFQELTLRNYEIYKSSLKK